MWHVDVHGEWVILWVAAMYNVLAILSSLVLSKAECTLHAGEWVMLWVAAVYNVLPVLSMVDMVCLACMQKLWSP